MPVYYFVKFQDGSNDIVHSSWMMGDDFCRWPPGDNTRSIASLVKYGKKPSNDWGVYKVTVSGTSDEYDELVKKSYYEDSYSEASQSESEPSCSFQSPDRRSGEMHFVDEMPLRRSGRSPRKRAMTSQASGSIILPQISPIKRGRGSANVEEHRDIESIIRNGFMQINNKLDSIMKALESETGEKRWKPPSPLIPPCSELTDLADWGSNSDPVLAATRVEKPNLRSTVLTFVRTTMSKSLASSFTWSGMGDKRRVSAKNNFRDNIIFKFLIDVLDHTAFKHPKMTDLAEAVKKTLYNVKDWEGGRSVRSRSSTPVPSTSTVIEETRPSTPISVDIET